MFSILGVSHDHRHCRGLEVSDERFVRGIEKRHRGYWFDSGLEHSIVIDPETTI